MGMTGCVKLCEFIRLYVLDWQVLSALVIPIIFGIMFPIYLFGICPLIWSSDPASYRPRSWILGYWLFASIVWFIFLAICLYHMRNGHQVALRGSCGMRSSDSTEDIWNEDKYLPEMCFPTPEYFVSITAVQPSATTDDRQVEPRQEVEETWDYNFEDQHQPRKFPIVSSTQSGSSILQIGKTGSDNGKRKFSYILSSKTPAATANPRSHEQFDLSSDEEDHNSQWTNIFQPTNNHYYSTESSPQRKDSGDLVSPKLSCLCSEVYAKLQNSEVRPSKSFPECLTEITIDKPEEPNSIGDRKDSVVTDDKFNLIIASLQSLAIEIERDFQPEPQQNCSLSRTQSESKLTTSDFE